MKTKILCTLGPSSLSPEVIRGLDARRVDLFRINLSHTPAHKVEEIVALVRGCSSTPICLDTQGAQVRCGAMADDVALVKGASVRLTAQEAVGTAERITLWPSSVFESLQVDGAVSIDFDGALLRVTSVGDGEAQAEVVEGGRVKSNRAVNVNPAPALPPLTDEDREAIAVGVRLGIKHFALSFASCAADVELARMLTPKGSHIISKIENRAGVRNMEEIIDASDAVLVDRGDLSREVPLEYVPFYQKVIVRQANRANRPVFVATNLLESMVTNRRPTLAEANDIANTLIDGVHGLVLAAETAIGIDPLRAVDIVRNSIEAFERSSTSMLLHQDRAEAPSWTRMAS
ncbi:MAG: pyruvate kinase [bacterium]